MNRWWKECIKDNFQRLEMAGKSKEQAEKGRIIKTRELEEGGWPLRAIWWRRNAFLLQALGLCKRDRNVIKEKQEAQNKKMCLKYWLSIQNYFMGINKNHFPFEIQYIGSVDIWSSTTLMKRRKIKSMSLIDTTAVHWWVLVGYKRMRVDTLSLNQPQRELILRCLFMVQNVYVLWHTTVHFLCTYELRTFFGPII